MLSTSFPVAALAGMALYVGVYHLIVDLRRPTPKHRDLWFAGTAFLLAIYDVVSIGLYEARDLATGASFQRLQLVTMGMTVLPFVRFIEAYTETGIAPVLRRLVWTFPIVALAGLFGPIDWMLATEPSIKRITVPLAGEVIYFERVLGPLALVINLSVPMIIAIAIEAAYRAHARGATKRARWFALGSAFFILAVVNDALVAAGLWHSVYMIEYGWTGVLLLMGFSLSEEIAEAARAREELLESRTRLAHAERLESVGKLAGGVAHDLNNMLTPVLGYAELARRRTAPDSKERVYLGHVLSATERAAALTRQLLAFGRKQVLEVRPIDLGEVLREVAPLLVRLLPEGTSLRTHVDPDVPSVVADRAQFEQVMMNLVANARDAMPEGGEVSISVSTGRNVTGPGTVRIEVRDNGVGMDDDVARRIFEPFYTTKARGKGTGLGLSIVHGIVSQHGGTIDVASARGFGTKFVIRLPASEKRADAEVAPRKLRLVGSHGGERVLVVDDDPVVRHLMEELLSELGFRVRAAGSAEELRGLLTGAIAPFDLLVSDVVLDDATGPEIRALVESRQGPIRCLFVSGHSEDVLTPRGVLEDGVSLLRKPFTPDEFAAQVRLVLDREASDSTPPAFAKKSS